MSARYIPSGAKAPFSEVVYGAAEAAPFQNEAVPFQNEHLIKIGVSGTMGGEATA